MTNPEEHELDLHGGYDPELPFLYALEREIARRARRTYEAREHQRAISPRAYAQRVGAPPSRRGASARGALPTGRRAAGARGRGAEAGRRRRRAFAPAGTRMARRSLTLVALLCLLGASAYGAGRFLSGGPANPVDVRQSAFVQVAAGSSGPDHWSLRVYMRGAELCRVLVVADAESSRCSAPPRARSLGVTSVVSPTRRYLYGVSGAAVARVQVRAGSTLGAALTRALGAPAAASGLSPRERWFVAVLRRPVGEPDPRAVVRGIGANGSFTGAPVSDCAEGTEAQICAR